jgi:hypothetical protein
MSLITISAGDIAEYHGSGLPAYARLYANQQFTSSEGVVIAQGSKSKPNFYQEFVCSLVGVTVRVASGDAYTTTDSDQPAATYTLCIYDANGRLLLTPYSELRIPPTNNPTTWKVLEVFSAARVLRDAPTYLSSQEILRILETYTSIGPKAALNLIGSTELTRDPASLPRPKAVGDNDPRVNKINAGLYSAVGGFSAAVAAAVTAASLSNTGLAVLSVTERILLSANVTIPSQVILETDSLGLINMNGHTLTVQGEIRAGAQQIFENYTSNPPNIASARAEAFYFEWYGITPGNNNRAAMQALIDARRGVLYGTTQIRLMPDTVYSIDTPLNFNDTFGIALAGPDVGYRANAEIRYRGTSGTTAITFKSSQGFSATGIKFSYTDSGFTGKLVEAGHSATGGDTSGAVFTKCFFTGESGMAFSAAALLSLDNTIIVKVQDCQFGSAVIGVKGSSGSYSNLVVVDNCTFNDCVYATFNPVQAWTIRNNTFEPLEHNDPVEGAIVGEVRAVGIDAVAFCWDLKFEGNWIGDISPTNNEYSVVKVFGGFGAEISGNLFYLPPMAGLGGVITAIELSGCKGVTIQNNYVRGDQFISASVANSAAVAIIGNDAECTVNEYVSAGATIGGLTSFANASGVNYVNGNLEVNGSTAFNNDAGSAMGVKIAARSSSFPANGNGAMIYSAESIATTNDGDLVIQPRTNAARKVLFRFAAGIMLKVGANIEAFTHLLFGTDNTYDIGAVGVTRPRNVYVGTNLFVADDAYAAGWDGSTAVPTKNAVYDKIQTLAPLVSPTFTTPALGVAAATSLAIGGGTVIAKVLKGSVTINPASVAGNTVADQTFTLTGAVVGDVVELNVPTAGITAGLNVIMAWISATDTVKVRFHNTTGGAIDEASATWFYKLTR